MSDALAILDAENPKKALQAARWRQTDYGKDVLDREGWIIETWYFEKGTFRFYLEKIDENPEHPGSHVWRIGIKQINAAGWKTSGSLTDAMGVVQRGLSYAEALARAIKWADHNTLGAPRVRPRVQEAETPKKTFYAG